MFWNGSTAIDGLSGSVSATVGPRPVAEARTTIDPHRLRDVLQLLLAHIADVSASFALDLLVGVVGKTDAAGCGERLQPRGDVDAVAEDVALVDDDVADIDADAELDATIFRNGSAALRHAALHLHRAAHGIDDAREFDQEHRRRSS